MISCQTLSRLLACGCLRSQERIKKAIAEAETIEEVTRLEKAS